MDISFHRYQSPQAVQQTSQKISSKGAKSDFVIVVCLVVLVCFTLAACGPAKESADQNQLTAATQQIAQDYATTGDLATAQAALAALDVANPNQWLLYVAETTAKDSAASPDLMNALIKLTEASGLRSPLLIQYANDHGLTTASALTGSQSQTVVNVASVQQPKVDVQSISQPVAVAPSAGDSAPAVVEATATAEATATPLQAAQILASTIVNLRTGPGTEYDLAGMLQVGESAQILAKNQDATWWQVQLGSGLQGWVFSELVQTTGTLDAIAVAANIPPPPTAAPVAVAQATQAPAAAAPTQPAATAAPQQNSGAPYFKMVQRRMWSKAENGDCRGQHLLRITVIDANGVRLNGVSLKGIYTGAVYRTGDQGKGDGIMEFDLYGSGEGFTVANDTNGADASSDRAEGFTTNSRDIDKPTLIQGGYCSDDATCQTFYDSWGCKGHHSWEATFQRNY